MALNYFLSAKVSDIDKARELVVQALNADGCKVRVESSSRLTASRGSQLKMRLVGGAFVNIKVLPVLLAVDFIRTETDQRVNFSAVDDLELGLMVGMKTRYEQAVQDIATVGYMAVNSIMLSEETTPPAAPAGRFCGSCGSQVLANAGFCSSCGSAVA